MKKIFLIILLLFVSFNLYAADTTMTGLVELATTPADDDELFIKDTSDTTQSVNGSTKKITVSNLLSGVVLTESDSVVGAITGIVKADGVGNISAASAGTDYQSPLSAGTDYLAPNGSASQLTGYSTGAQPASANLNTWSNATPGSGITAWIATPSSSNLASAVTGETGSGALMFGTSPTIITSLLMTNASDLRVATTTTAHEFSISLYDNDDTTWRDGWTFSNGDSPTITAGPIAFNFTGAGSISMGPMVFADADGSPDTVGQIRYDNTITNIDDGGFVWYDDDEVKLFVDMAAATASACSDDYVVAYDADIDKWYCKADADTGGATPINDIGDAAADGTIAQTGYKQTWTSTLNTAGSIWTFTNTTADLTADVSFLDFKYTDDGDANGFFLRGYDNAAGDLKWSIAADGLFTTGQLNPISSDGAALGTTSLMWSDAFLASGAVINFNNGDVTLTHSANTLAFAGASTAYTFDAPVRLLASDDPDTATAGDLTLDTDGWIRVYNASRQNAVRLFDTIQVVVYKPNDMADAQRDAFGPIFTNTSGMSFVVTGWDCTSSDDNTTLNIEETDADGANNATVDAVEIATDGTGLYYASDATITAATIETGHKVWLDFDDTDTPSQVSCTIDGYYNADVN